MLRCAVTRNGRFNHRNSIRCPDRPAGVGGQILPRVFIEKSEDAKASSIFGLILDKIPAPYGRGLTARRRSLVPGPRRRILLCLARTCIPAMRRSRWNRLPLIVKPLRRNSAVMRR